LGKRKQCLEAGKEEERKRTRAIKRKEISSADEVDEKKHNTKRKIRRKKRIQ